MLAAKRKYKTEKRNYSNYKAGSVRKQKIIFWILLGIVILLAALNLAKAKGFLIPEQPGIRIVNGTVELDSFTLEQKIAQMVIVAGYSTHLEPWRKMQLGGIHLFALQNEDLFRETIREYQYNMTLSFLVTVDLEGCVSPFAAFRYFPFVSRISTPQKALEKGQQEGQYLQSLGVTLNFAPVVDLDDSIWNCRAFPGSEEHVAILAREYILGLQQQGVLATAKHYPGKTLIVSDPHKYVVAATIEARDVYPYSQLSSDVASIMVSHIISSGAVDSQGIPAVASADVIGKLKQNFSGLVISDEINMLGLKNYYPTLDEMYIAVFKAGNDIVLNFNEDPNEIYRMIQVVKGAVERGEISEELIDDSVRKILKAKGLKVE